MIGGGKAFLGRQVGDVEVEVFWVAIGFLF